LASTRHAATAATPRAIGITGYISRIPIRPKYHSTGRAPTSRHPAVSRPDTAHLRTKV
jgi:hypothetical protein